MPTVRHIKDTLLLLSALVSALLLLHLHILSPFPTPNFSISTDSTPLPPPNLSLRNLVFSIASSASSLPSRASYIRLWYTPISHLNTTSLFLDRHPILSGELSNTLLPPIIIPQNSNSVSAGHRIAKIVKDAFTFSNDNPNTYWYVFGDDDTVFFVDNLVRVLSKYDHNRWYYVGCSSESYDQNDKFSFDMAFGGGGFAISVSLMRVLATVMDSCLRRYMHLYGSDARVFACIAELGVRLTVEPGFHQVVDRNKLLPEVLSLQRTFRPWKRGKNVSSSRYMFNTREFPKDRCKKPVVFFLHSVVTDPDGVWTHYMGNNIRNCSRGEVIQELKVISVFSRNLDLDIEQMKAPRRDCCDIISTSDENMVIHVRKCGMDELISMKEEK